MAAYKTSDSLVFLTLLKPSNLYLVEIEYTHLIAFHVLRSL